MATDKTLIEKFKVLFSAEKIKEIKQLFDIPAIEPAVENTFVDVKTTDGAVLRIDGGTKVGSKCSLISAEGEAPADGAYTLEDGTAITAKAGVIEAVTPATEAPAEDPAKMNELAEVKESVKSITYKYAEIEKLISDNATANKEAFEKVTKENEKLSAQNKAMFALIEQMAELPTEEPAQPVKNKTTDGALAAFRAEVKEMKAARRELRN